MKTKLLQSGKIQNISNKKIITSIFYCIVILMFITTTFLFYQQLNYNPDIGEYASDLPSHVGWGINGEGYSLFNRVVYILYKLTKNQTTIAIALGCMTLATPLAMTKLLDFLLKQNGITFSFKSIYLICSALLFLSNIYVPYINPYFYAYSRITQPWHNPTYYLMRVFGFLAVLYYLLIEKDYLKTISLKNWLLFTLTLFLTNYAKSSFIIFFAPMMLIYLICDFIKLRGKNILQATKFGMCVIFSLIISLYQSYILFPSGGNDGVKICFDDLLHLITSPQEIASVMLSLIFPFSMWYLCKNLKIEHKTLNKSWVMFIIAFFLPLLLKETGRSGAGNFGWSVYFAGILLYVFSIAKYIYIKKNLTTIQNPLYKNIFYLATFVLILNILNGLIYFGIIFTGHTYMI